MVYSVFLWNLKCLASPNPKLGSRSQNINDCHDSHDADHAAFGEVILSIVDAICMQNLKYVALPIPKLDSGSQCLTRHTPLDLPLLYLYTLPIPPKNSWTFIHIFFINPSQCLKIPISPMLGKTDHISRPGSGSVPKPNWFMPGPPFHENWSTNLWAILFTEKNKQANSQINKVKILPLPFGEGNYLK